ncbi:hypothetical protein QJS10_CPA05g00626 [Acorus calamus]|uniref:Homoserine dehydrogenase n=1 Tax=Acorus calamus TaxID=4465 RepID=A0AAV9EV51_ACOCL|nr:hypothetical protein QJS10_CPA05g00626 [Acorus calamus]
MMRLKKIPLILMGCGGVGQQLLQHIVTCRPLHAKLGLHLRVLGVCDSRSILVANDIFTAELGDSSLHAVCRVKSSGASLSASSDGFGGDCQVLSDSEAPRKVVDIAGLLGRSTGLVVVDCSASPETVEVLKDVIDHGCCIVLANKKPLTTEMKDYEKLLSNIRRIRYESTPTSLCWETGYIDDDVQVGAGLPVISSINRVLTSGDPISRIVGSLSGTLGYVMSEVEDGKPFSQVVRAAKCLGYTEPDPRDDLSGMDVARKALILARLLGSQLDLGDIKVESLYPDEMGSTAMSTEDFLQDGLASLDVGIAERIKVAASNGCVLRYVCVVEGPRCQVGLQELPKDSPLGRLRGSDNVVEIYSRCYKDSPLVIQGAGAGNDTTAAGVLADIVDIQDLFK